MILYLSSNENLGLFDFLQEEQGITIKHLSGEFNLKNFVLRDMKSLGHYNCVVIDYSCLTDNYDEIIEAVESFKWMYSSRLIFFCEGLKRGNSLLLKLIENDIYNIITSEKFEDIQNEIRICTSIEGKSYQDCLRYRIDAEVLKEYTFASNIQIAVAGVSSKVGTTTTAINMANFLASIGAKVSYVELNGQDHLSKLPIIYKKDDHLEFKGVKYYDKSGKLDDEMNFVIYDLGIMNEKKESFLSQMDARLICATAKPYELGPLIAVKKDLNSAVDIILSFVSPNSRGSIKKMFETEDQKVSFAEYSPDLFDGYKNKDLFFNILDSYIKEKII